MKSTGQSKSHSKGKGNESIYIYGVHAVTEALRNTPEAVIGVLCADGVAQGELGSLMKQANITRSRLDPRMLPKGIERGAVHQGIIARINPEKLLRDYKDFIPTLLDGSGLATSPVGLVILGEVQDPHNVGAVIRSAAAFGISGVLIPEHRQAGITGSVIKVSAGMAFRVPLVSIGNVNNTVRDLKEKGFWIYGLAGESEHSLTDEQFDRPSVFILGNEATGIREKTLEACDIVLRIPMHKQCESLNAATSASIALYQWSTQHREALQ